MQLTESVPLQQHEVLCRGLRDYLGVRDAKVSDNDVLRPPGTLNHKGRPRGSESTPVEWLIRPTGDRIDPHKLAELLGIERAHPRPSVGTAESVWDDEAEEVPQLELRYSRGARRADAQHG